MSSHENRELHDQLEQAKETLNRLRCINGLVPTCCAGSVKKCHGCRSYSHDVTIGRCSERDGKASGLIRNDYELHNWRKKGENSRGSRVESAVSRVASRVGNHTSSVGSTGRNFSRVDSNLYVGSNVGTRGDLERLHRQIDSLEESVRGPILSYVENMERRNIDMSEAVESIRQQLLRHERVCPVSSGALGMGSGNWSNSSRDLRSLGLQPEASLKAEKEARVVVVEKELEACKEKLERSEARVKELFRSLSQTQSGKGDGLLETQLQRQQQLAENYFKESTSKDREISFLTIEKYNLESEVKSLITGLETSNQKRQEISQENKRLEATLEECCAALASLEQQLKDVRSEKKRVKTQFRGALEEERVRGEKNSENQSFQEKEIKELRKKCHKYEDNRTSQKGVLQQLESARDELLMKARNLSNEYKIKLSECGSLREENQRLTKEITDGQLQVSLSKKESSNSKTCMESLKTELAEAKSYVKSLECSLQESKVIESKNSTELTAFTHKETSLVVLAESVEKERLAAVNELEATKIREKEFKNEAVGLKEKLEKSRVDVLEMTQMSALVKADLDLTREKYYQLKKTSDEMVLSNNNAIFLSEATQEELINLKSSYEELGEKNSQLSADLKAYKRIITEKEELLRRVEHELAQLHKAKDGELKELLKKDREIAFLKARVSSSERRISSRTPGGNDGASDSRGDHGKDAEVYLERIVELESECKAQKMQIDDSMKKEYYSKKDAQKSETLKEELANREDQVDKLKRELSRSKQELEELREKEEQLLIARDEKEKLRVEVTRLQAKVEEVTELKQAYEQKEEEMRALRRMSSEEVDLEGKISRLKDRCREKDEEIEELHQKVIALQVKIKDFMQQNSLIEEQMRNVKDRCSIEQEEKEKLSQSLKNNETKYRNTETELQESRKLVEDLEKELSQTKRVVDNLETENDDVTQANTELTERSKTREGEIENFRKQVLDLEEAARLAEEAARDNEDMPEETSTPMDNISLENSLRLNRSGRASVALERLDVLEDENVQLLCKQRELEDELDAAEEHAEELKNALKGKRENVNELYAELDTVKERLKSSEKARHELTDENEQLQQSYTSSQKKVEDMKITNERYMDEADEIEKALTVAEKKVDDLEKRLEEVSGKCASSEGQLQSVTERLARKDKELHVVETHVEEQRKLCDGYKASAEKQEALVEKLRVEKTSVDEELLALKLEIAKKEGTYKSGKEKIAEIQARLYETEDEYSNKTNECKKLSRENERLKRDISELERKVSDLQTSKKSKMSMDVNETPSSAGYNSKFHNLNTAVKGNAQNVEGLDTKLNSAQNKISTLEVALANDLRKFSLQRTSSDTPRRGYSPGDHQLSPGYGSLRRPRSSSSMTSDYMGDYGTAVSPVVGSSASVEGDNKEYIAARLQVGETPTRYESEITRVDSSTTVDTSATSRIEFVLDTSSTTRGESATISTDSETVREGSTRTESGTSHDGSTAVRTESITTRDETVLSGYDVASLRGNSGEADALRSSGIEINISTDDSKEFDPFPGLVDFFHSEGGDEESTTPLVLHSVSNVEASLFELDPFLSGKAPSSTESLGPLHDGETSEMAGHHSDHPIGHNSGTDHHSGQHTGDHTGETSDAECPVREQVTCSSTVRCGDHNTAIPGSEVKHWNTGEEEMIYF